MTRAFMPALAALALAANCLSAQERPLPPLINIGIDQRLDSQVPLDLTFRDEAGHEVPLQKYFAGRPVILVLVYYRCPGLCNRSLNGLTETLRGLPFLLGKDYDVVTVSFDPREKPALAAEKRKAYLEELGRPVAGDAWHFLTGDELPTQRLAQAVGFRYAFDPGNDQFQHAAGLMVLTPEGKISRYFYGLEYPTQDVRFALEDASEGKIGSRVTRPLRLLCYAYDPATGRYNFLPLRLVQAGGVLTVLVLGGYMLVQFRRDRVRGRAIREGGAA
jgi:protein SCO1/2